ncbi:hypothetical protein MBAV_000629 [Candidatus Magnetobacterium bavaricum]|uniref:Uncharacterized protein n=1 Tax=Candidatus Magnetobacterium bavaricum TaxID=29290 RepID=A0A0F3H2K6_9BACT|nr:hypothetical protein MBAV_000629 [Candidatus Magnetobacterium bavaricum]
MHNGVAGDYQANTAPGKRLIKLNKRIRDKPPFIRTLFVGGGANQAVFQLDVSYKK